MTDRRSAGTASADHRRHVPEAATPQRDPFRGARLSIVRREPSSSSACLAFEKGEITCGNRGAGVEGGSVGLPTDRAMTQDDERNMGRLGSNASAEAAASHHGASSSVSVAPPDGSGARRPGPPPATAWHAESRCGKATKVDRSALRPREWQRLVGVWVCARHHSRRRWLVLRLRPVGAAMWKRSPGLERRSLRTGPAAPRAWSAGWRRAAVGTRSSLPDGSGCSRSPSRWPRFCE